MEQVDDRDPRIIYSGNWGQWGSTDEYNSTTSYTKSGNASFSFTFNGTYIAVYGTLNNKGTRDSFTIFTLDNVVHSIFASQRTHRTVNQVMYSSPEFTNGEHNLLVRNLVEQGMTYIDYLQVRPNGSKLAVLPPSDTLNLTSSSPTPAQSCPLAPLPSSIVIATTVTATIGMTISPTSRPSALQNVSPSAAAGIGVAGTLGFVACVILAQWIMNRRGTEKRDELQNNMSPTPFLLSASKSTLATGGPSGRRNTRKNGINPPSYRP
ncbi:hypothetical protein Moror_17760 [Moniliophthora roreri MCA 2997]|uniref:Transmembrane protein n=1 Tax=Moniliophthora roreri (strain MCA 2997) TaxID=1381753 RepID=V2Z043_MONRO|nr:hypothetical protein Moror_17760 [Moniliophthora roreri MCA 2997]KAI3618894.1 hypothetical protein WG66_000482 [Moniliophthora roreri]